MPDSVGMTDPVKKWMDPKRDRVALARDALEAALRQARYDGVRDLHEALHSGKFAVQGLGMADLGRGWGTVGDATSTRPQTGCPLAALFLNEARQLGGGTGLAAHISRVRMEKEGFTPEDFYMAWDGRLLDQIDLRIQVEKHLVARTD